MDWAHLVVALLVVAMVLPVVLRVFDLLSATETLVIWTGAFAASTVYCFLRGEAGGVAWWAALTVTVLLILRRRRADARNNTTTSRV